MISTTNRNVIEEINDFNEKLRKFLPICIIRMFVEILVNIILRWQQLLYLRAIIIFSYHHQYFKSIIILIYLFPCMILVMNILIKNYCQYLLRVLLSWFFFCHEMQQLDLKFSHSSCLFRSHTTI